MKDLIKIEEKNFNGELIQTVNARGLHAFLEVKSDFRNWIKNRINDYGFIENQDFITFGKNLPNGGRTIEYFIPLNTGKELSMVERNDKGREARQYFIACEKELKAKQAPKTQGEIIVEMALAYREQEQRIIAVEERQRITEGKIEDFSTGAEHFSITAYNKLFLAQQISNSQANSDGRKLTKAAKNQGIILGTAPHPVWGTVNTYPKALLDAHYRGDFN